MNTIITLICLLFYVTSCSTLPTAEVVATFDRRPGNPSVSPDGRIFATLHPLDTPLTKLVEITSNNKKIPYPTKSYADGKDSKIKASISVRTDNDGVAWILDLGAKRFIAWDTRGERLLKTIDIKESSLTQLSFLQDFALDQKRNRAIIADMTQSDLKSVATPAFVVVDLETGKSKRVAESHPSMMPTKEVLGALNPITIDPDYEWIYYGALNGRTIYRVPAAAFDGDVSQVASLIETYGPKPYSDGITVDSAGNVYITDIEKHAIGITRPGSYKIIANLPEGQSWPDGFSFGPDGYVYSTVNQLNRTPVFSPTGEEMGKPPYQIVRIKGLAQSAVGR